MMNNEQQLEQVEEPLSLSSDIKRACELLEKLQKSKYCGEVPATKLAALQKVLQSDFLTAVREVYEHIYETVDIEGMRCSPNVFLFCSVVKLKVGSGQGQVNVRVQGQA